MKDKQRVNNNNKEEAQIFNCKSKYLLRCLDGGDWWFTGNHVVIDDHFIEYRKRNWHFISVDSVQFHWQYVQNITVDKHIFGATIKITTSDASIFFIRGLSKKSADKIRVYAHNFIAKNSQRGTMDALAGAIASAVGNSRPATSNADELMKYKQLYDQGIISEDEFLNAKKKLL